MLKTALITAALSLANLPAAYAGDPTQAAFSYRILDGWVQADGTRMAGLELTLAPGWKTYWRSPGDAGIPPEFDWSRARNLDSVQVHWPTPSVFWQSGMRSVGYKDRVVLPLSISPRNQGQDIRLRAKVDIGICSDICVPASFRIDAVLPSQANTRTPAIAAALANLPYSAAEAGVRSAACTLSPTVDGLSIEARLDMPAVSGTTQAVIEAGTPGIWVSEPTTERHGNHYILRAEMMHHQGRPMLIDRSELRITMIGSGMAVDIRGCSD